MWLIGFINVSIYFTYETLRLFNQINFYVVLIKKSQINFETSHGSQDFISDFVSPERFHSDFIRIAH